MHLPDEQLYQSARSIQHAKASFVFMLY